MFSNKAIIGKTIMPEPNSEHISKNPIVSLPRWTLNGGSWMLGNPGGIWPKE